MSVLEYQQFERMHMRRLRFFIGALVAALWAVPLAAQEPTGTIRGRILDESQQPIYGASVSYAGRTALTQQDGRYFLTVRAGTDSLRVRLLGYLPASRQVVVTANQTATVDLVMTAQAVSLGEIVVTGYGEQRAGNITGAVSTVGSEEFNTGRIVSAAQLISAKTPGVEVVDNNEPGGGLTVRIRGATSVNASSEPLYIVDGMPMGGTSAGTGLSSGRDGLNFLNPADIENMTVLRDASAAAIYGANAANGVVIITTRGRQGMGGRQGSRFEYTGSFSTSSVDNLPDMLSGQEFRTAVQTYAPQNVNQLQSANTDWFDNILQGGYGQEHNLSLTNAGDGNFLRLSLGYLNQDGIVQGTNVERVTLGVNYQQLFFNNRLDLRINAKGSRADDMYTPGGVLSNAAQMGPTQPVYDSTTTTGYYDWPGNTLQSPDNPVAILGLATDEGTTYRSVGNARAEYTLPWIQGLRANLNLGYDIARAQRSSFTPSTLHSQTKTGTGGTDYRRTPSEQNTVLETYLNYIRSAGPGSVDITGGYSYQRSYGEYPWYQATGLSTDVLGGNGTTSATTVQNGMDVQESKLISFFGRLNYNIADRYLIAATVRRDGSSRFGEDNAWGTFPSVSLGWRMSEESFLRGIDALSDLKLRAAWALTGNQAFGNYQQYATYRFGDNQTQVQFGNTFVPTIRPSAVDPNIKWEETNATNLGLDFGLWNQRLTGSLDWYVKNTDDLIFNVPVAAGTNLSNYVTTNIGSMRNSGFELAMNLRAMDGGDGRLGWNFSFNASTNNNVLTGITGAVNQVLVGGVAGGVGTTIQVLRPGEPINSFFVYRHRTDASGNPVWATGPGADTAMYVDQNGDNIINVDDRVPYKNPRPKWQLGFSNYLTYGRLSLDFTLRAYLGNYVYNNVSSNLGTYSEVTRASPYNLHRSVLETGFETPQYLSDYYVEDASFLRLDNITLAYRFNYRSQPVRVFGTVQNAFTLTGYSGVDPTAGLNGIDNNIYPRSRTFTGGISLQF
jgi:iron complex outermembrane receptor protein